MPLVEIPTVGVIEFPDSMSSADIEKAIRENILKPKTSTTGYIREALKAVPRGAVSGLETAGLGLAALLPEETEKAAREKIKSAAESLKPSVAPGYEEAIPTKLGEAVGSIGSFLVPGLGAGRVAGMLGAGAAGVRAAQLGTTGVLAPAAGAGEAREKAITEGATPEQTRAATQFGAVVGLTELAPIERMFRGLGKDVAGSLIGRVKNALATGGMEGAQEAAAQVAQNLIAQQIYKPDQKLIEGVGEPAAYGAGAGAIVQFLLDAAAGRRAPRATPPQPSTVAPVAEPPIPTQPIPTAAQQPLLTPELAPVPTAPQAPPRAYTPAGDLLTAERVAPEIPSEALATDLDSAYNVLEVAEREIARAKAQINQTQDPAERVRLFEALEPLEARRKAAQQQVNALRKQVKDVTGEVVPTRRQAQKERERQMGMFDFEAEFVTPEAAAPEETLPPAVKEPAGPQAPEFQVTDASLKALGFKATSTRSALLKSLSGVNVATPEGYAAFEDAMNKTRAKVDEPLVTDFMARARRAFPPPLFQPTEGPRGKIVEPTIIGEPTAPAVTPEVALDFIRQRYEAGLPLTPAEQFRLREAQQAAPTPGLALPEQPTPQPLEVVENLPRQTPPLRLTQTQIPQPIEPTYPQAPMPEFVTEKSLETMGLAKRRDKAAVALRETLLAKDLNDPVDAQMVRDALRAYRDRTMTPKVTRDKIDAYLRAIPEQRELDFERDYSAERRVGEPSVGMPVSQRAPRKPRAVGPRRPDMDVSRKALEPSLERAQPEPTPLTPVAAWRQYAPEGAKYSQLSPEAREVWNREVGGRASPEELTGLAQEFSGDIREARTDLGDPSAQEAQTIQSAIEGKTPIQAAQWLAENAPDPSYRLIAAKVSTRLQQLQDAGLDLRLRVVHVGDRVPSALLRARGVAHSEYALGGGKMTVYLNGADVTGNVGVSYETLLHELVHAATMSAVRLGNLRVSQGTPLAKSVQDLFKLTNHLIREFNLRAGVDKTRLTPFERHVFTGAVNALQSPDEVLAWALTNRDAQTWMGSIPYQGESLWTKFVDAIRNFLGLTPREDTALSEVLRISDALLSVPVSEISALAGKAGTALQVQQIRAQIASTGNPTLDAYVQQRRDQLTRDGDRPWFTQVMDVFSSTNKFKKYAETFAVNIVDNQYVVKRRLEEAGQWEPRMHMAFASRAGDIAASSLITGPIKLQTLGGGRGVQTFGITEGKSIRDVMQTLQEVADALPTGGTKGQRFATASALFDSYTFVKRFNSFTPEMKAKYTIPPEVFAAAKEADRLYGAQFRKALDDWTEYKNALLEANRVAGRFSDEDVRAWREAPDYVPWNRILDDAKHGYQTKTSARSFFSSLKAGGDMKSLVGGDIAERPIGSMLNNMQSLAFWLATSAIKNHAAVIVADTVGTGAFGGRSIPDPAVPGVDKTRVIEVYKGGEKKYFELSDSLAAAAFLPIADAAGPLLKAVSSFTQLVRKGTTLMPGFVVNQLAQDSFRVATYSGVDRPFSAASRVLGQFVGDLRNDPLTQRLNRFGLEGQVDYIFSGQYGEKTRAAKQLAPADPGLRTAVNTLVEKLDRFAHASDMAQRRAVYEQTLKETGGDEALAMFRAIEIINFQNRGKSAISSTLRHSIPFFNAYLQGMNVSYRAMFQQGISGKDRQVALRQFYITAAKIATFSMFYTMLVSDDDDYEKMSPNERMRGWLLPGSREAMKELTGVDIGQNLKIPVPMDPAGLLAKGLPELFTTYIASQGTASEMDNRKLLRALRDGALNAVSAPNVVPQAAKPSLELLVNYSFFTGRPILGKGQEGKESFQQFTETTSEFSKMIGDFTNVSPIKLDYFIRGTLGMFGSTLLHLGSAAYSSAAGVQIPESRISDNPQLRAFFAGREGGGQREDYYDLREKIQMVNRTVNDLMKTRPEKLQEYLEENKELYALAKSGLTGKIDEWVQKFRTARQQIRAANLSPEETRRQLDRLEKAEVDMFARLNLATLRKQAGM